MKKWALLLLIIMITTPSLASEQLDEADASFTYKGKPIHPYLIAEFSNWLSDDRPPVVTTVDVSAAFDTNEYMQEDVKKRDDWWYVEKEQMDGNVKSYESFDYHWCGKTANGIHVIETGSSGGGSGFFMDLMLVKFSEGVISWEGKKEKQLLMSILGLHSLGDRYDGDIKVLPDKVIIGAAKNQYGGGAIDKDIEVKFTDGAE